VAFKDGVLWLYWTNKTHDRMQQNGSLLTVLHISFRWLKTSFAERVRDSVLFWLSIAGVV